MKCQKDKMEECCNDSFHFLKYCLLTGKKTIGKYIEPKKGKIDIAEQDFNCSFENHNVVKYQYFQKSFSSPVVGLTSILNLTSYLTYAIAWSNIDIISELLLLGHIPSALDILFILIIFVENEMKPHFQVTSGQYPLFYYDGDKILEIFHLLTQKCGKKYLTTHIFIDGNNYGSPFQYFLGETFKKFFWCSRRIKKLLKSICLDFNCDMPMWINKFHNISTFPYFTTRNSFIDYEIFEAFIRKITEKDRGIRYINSYALLHTVMYNHIDHQRFKLLLPWTDLNDRIESKKFGTCTVKERILCLSEIMLEREDKDEFEKIMTDLNKFNINMQNVSPEKIGGHWKKYKCLGFQNVINRCEKQKTVLSLKEFCFFSIRNSIGEGLPFSEKVKSLSLPKIFIDEILSLSNEKYISDFETPDHPLVAYNMLIKQNDFFYEYCLLYTSPSPRDS